MKASQIKTLAIVIVLLLLTGFLLVGCKKEVKPGWVNTSTLPGQRWKNHNNKASSQANSSVIYLGNDYKTPNYNFGPQEVSFDFKDLR